MMFVMRLARVTQFLVLVGALSSCATPYQQSGLRGGYKDAQVDSNTASVSFHGNAYTPKQKVQLALMYRCAQVRLQDGFDYFVIVNNDTEAKQSVYMTSGHYTEATSGSAHGAGNMAVGSATTTGTYYPPQAHTQTKYGSAALIKMFKGQKPQNDANAFDAHDVVAHLGATFGPTIQ